MLDAGESSAIPLAERLGATLLVDDMDARAIAGRRGLRVIGTLGVLVIAKRRGEIERLAPLLGAMTDRGMFVSAQLRAHVLELVGEVG